MYVRVSERERKKNIYIIYELTISLSISYVQRFPEEKRFSTVYSVSSFQKKSAENFCIHLMQTVIKSAFFLVAVLEISIWNQFYKETAYVKQIKT